MKTFHTITNASANPSNAVSLVSQHADILLRTHEDN